MQNRTVLHRSVKTGSKASLKITLLPKWRNASFGRPPVWHAHACSPEVSKDSRFVRIGALRPTARRARAGRRPARHYAHLRCSAPLSTSKALRASPCLLTSAALAKAKLLQLSKAEQDAERCKSVAFARARARRAEQGLRREANRFAGFMPFRLATAAETSAFRYCLRTRRVAYNPRLRGNPKTGLCQITIGIFP